MIWAANGVTEEEIKKIDPIHFAHLEMMSRIVERERPILQEQEIQKRVDEIINSKEAEKQIAAEAEKAIDKALRDILK